MNNRLVIDVSRLPTYAFGMRSITGWGTAGFMVIEGVLFALLVICYFYLRGLVPQWPPGVKPPDLLFGP